MVVVITWHMTDLGSIPSLSYQFFFFLVHLIKDIEELRDHLAYDRPGFNSQFELPLFFFQFI